MKLLRTHLANGALMLVFLCAALALGEAVVRLLFKHKEHALLFPRYHTDYRYGEYRLRGIRPSAEFWHTSVDGSWRFRTNSQGFRNERDVAYTKVSGTVRILAIGDSNTQGYEVRQEYTFSAVAERYFHYRGLRAEVLNAGVSGYGTAEALAFLENEGYKYHPDVVVLGFFANDFEDNLRAGLFELDSSGTLVPRKYEYLPGVSIQNLIYRIPGVRWLSENSYFYSLAFNGVWMYFKNRAAELAKLSHERHAPAGGASHAPASTFEYAVPKKVSLSEYDVALAVALIDRMQRFCRAHGIRLLVADIPDARGMRAVPSMPPALATRLQALGVEIVSGSVLLEPYDGTAETHVPHGDHHISEFTHTLLGVAIARRVSSDKMLLTQQSQTR
jgi:hypothetical protein